MLDRDLHSISIPAASDISAGQFRIVAVDSSGRAVLANGTADKVIGVLQNKPSGTLVPASVGIFGVTRCVAGGSITAGDTVVANAQGFALSGSGATSRVAGIAISTAQGSTDLFELLLSPHVV